MLQDEVIRSIVVPHRHFRSEDNALLFSIESSEANQYSRDLKAAVKRGLYQKCALGHPPNIAPQGYLNTKRVESGSNEIVPDPERWTPIRKAFDLMLTRHHSIAEVADILNREYNFKTRPSRQRSGSPLSTSVLHRVLINPFYTGYFNYSGKQYKGTYKPMITLEEFDMIQEILGRKERSKAHKHEFAFTGFIKCGSCGCAVTASRKLKKVKATGVYREYTFYHCTKRRGKASCADKRYTTEREMREMIASELERLALRPKWKVWAFDTIKEDFDEEVSKQQKLLQSTREYEQKLTNELDTLLDLRISGDLSDEQYHNKKAEREALLMRVREKQNRVEDNISNWIEQVKEKLDFAEAAALNFSSGTPQLQKSICYAIGWNWVLQAKKLTFTRAEWFTDLQKLKEYFEAEIVRLEPINTFMEYRQNCFISSRPSHIVESSG
jgi:site-specific DNA recombinase